VNELVEAALDYAGRRWRVFPLHGLVNGSCTCGRSSCFSPGKHPLVRRGLYEATTDARVIEEWWRRWRSANVGIVTGAVSEIAVIDVDLPAAFVSLDRLVDAGLPVTLTGLTGGGGLHLLYGCDNEELGNSAGRLPGLEGDLPGVDLRANGGYVVAPPSTHASGGRYAWMSTDVPVAPVPGWLKQPLRTYVAPDVTGVAEFEGDGTPYGLAVFRDELDRLRVAQVGTRNHQLNCSAFALAQLVGGGELLEGPARSAVLGVALAIGLDEPEARQTIDSGFEAGLAQPRVAPHRKARPRS
jgi:hypothetical protein